MSSLQSLVEQRALWRARDNSVSGSVTQSTGWRHLDAVLPGDGWPQASVTELLSAQPELALRVLQYALVRVTQRQRLLIWVAMPWLPYAPAWLHAGLDLKRVLIVSAQGKNVAWSLEQALRLARGAAVISCVSTLDLKQSRRLQLAAQAGESFAFLLRPLSALKETNAAAVRLQVDAHEQGVQLTLHKRRGSFALPPFVLKRPNDDCQWPSRPGTPIFSDRISALDSTRVPLSEPLSSASSVSSDLEPTQVDLWQ